MNIYGGNSINIQANCLRNKLKTFTTSAPGMHTVLDTAYKGA